MDQISERQLLTEKYFNYAKATRENNNPVMSFNKFKAIFEDDGSDCCGGDWNEIPQTF